MSQARSDSWKRPAFTLLLLLAAGIGVARSAGQEFRLFRFEKEIGLESFAVAPAPEAGLVSVTGASRVDMSGRIVTTSQLLVVEDRTYSLREYRVDADVQGEKQSVAARRIADSIVVEISAGGTGLRRSFHVSGEALVLDNLAMSHLALLAMRSAARAFRPETLQVVVPQVGALLDAHVAPEPPAPDGSRKIGVRIGSVTEVIRIGPTGVAVGADIPSQGLRYETAAIGAASSSEQPPAPRTEVDRTVPVGEAKPTRALFEEQPVSFDSNGTRLDGILTLPRGGQRIPYPAVLFVHDSGAQDRDETLGPNRPFFELARGLAVYGIASFRYDKRTLAAPQTVHPLRSTVQDEVLDDALAALELLRTKGAIDGHRLWILGHGLGGSLAPTIARADGGVFGIIALAGSLRPIDAILRDRILAAGSGAGNLGGADPISGGDTRAMLAILDSLEAGTLPDSRIVMGIGSPYLRDYRARDLAGDFAGFKGPSLLLFAGKDDRIGPADVDSWTTAAARVGKKNSVSHTYPGLGHLFIPIVGEPSAEALTVPGNVDPAVIERVARFILTPP